MIVWLLGALTQVVVDACSERILQSIRWVLNRKARRRSLKLKVERFVAKAAQFDIDSSKLLSELDELEEDELLSEVTSLSNKSSSLAGSVADLDLTPYVAQRAAFLSQAQANLVAVLKESRNEDSGESERLREAVGQVSNDLKGLCRPLVRRCRRRPFRTSRNLPIPLASSRTSRSIGEEVAIQRINAGYRSVFAGHADETTVLKRAAQLGFDIDRELEGDRWPLYVMEAVDGAGSQRTAAEQEKSEARTRAIVSVPAVFLGFVVGVTWGWFYGLPVVALSVAQFVRNLQVPPFDRKMAQQLLLQQTHESAGSRAAYWAGFEMAHESR